MQNYEKLILQMRSLVIFRNLLRDKIIIDLMEVLASVNRAAQSPGETIGCYSGFLHGLYQSGMDLTEYIWKRILADENIYVLSKAEKKDISPVLEKSLTNELQILRQLAAVKSEEIISQIPYEGLLPGWTNSGLDFESLYRKRMEDLPTVGYGHFIGHLMFVFENDALIPVKSPDGVRLSHLWGYEASRKKVIDNTLALLAGKPASNVLLYGDAGTGKSSTVKAIVNEYGHRGLRLVEVRKSQLLQIPNLIETISRNPLRFILFIDDLSFAQSNEDIGALKAILEGTASAKPSNVVIYATSNRRHLIKETLSERGDDDIHRFETLQEQTSLSDRFGMFVSFFKPDKDEYLKIVFALARQYQLKNTENLELLAERHALERGGRSGRAARQLIEYLKSMEE